MTLILFSSSVAFQFGDQIQRVYALEIQIEDDQAGLRLGLRQHLVLVLDEVHRHAGALGGVADLHEKNRSLTTARTFLLCFCIEFSYNSSPEIQVPFSSS